MSRVVHAEEGKPSVRSRQPRRGPVIGWDPVLLRRGSEAVAARPVEVQRPRLVAHVVADEVAVAGCKVQFRARQAKKRGESTCSEGYIDPFTATKQSTHTISNYVLASNTWVHILKGLH